MWVFETMWRHRGIFLIFFVVMWVFWQYGVKPDKPDNKPQEAVQQVQEEPKWNCRVWEEPVNINGHSATLERCWVGDSERYRLYVGNEVLLEELYFKGVFMARAINTDLLKRLTKQKDMKT